MPAGASSIQIGIQDGVPGLLGDLDNRHAIGAWRRGGIIHEDVESPEGLERRGDDAVDLAGRPDLLRDALQSSPAGLRFGVDDSGSARCNVREHEIGAIGRQTPGDPAADAMLAAAPDHQRHFSVTGESP